MRLVIAYERHAPVIDRTYKLGETQATVRYLEEGHARGKVVITTD